MFNSDDLPGDEIIEFHKFFHKNCSHIPFGGSIAREHSVLVFLTILIAISFLYLMIVSVMTVWGAIETRKSRRKLSKQIEQRKQSSTYDLWSIEDHRKVSDMYEIISPQYVRQVLSAKEDEIDNISDEDNFVEIAADRLDSWEEDADNLLRFIMTASCDPKMIEQDESEPCRRTKKTSIDSATSCESPQEERRSSKNLRNPHIYGILRKKSIQDSPIMVKESFRSIPRYNSRRLGVSFQRRSPENSLQRRRTISETFSHSTIDISKK